MESVGGVPADIQLSKSHLLSAAAEEHAISSKSSSRAVKKAPQTPLAFVASMERIAIVLHQPKFVRAFSWYRLVCLWSGMRFDDHRGLLPSKLRIQDAALRGTPVRTKTTGAGRKKEELYTLVAPTAFVVIGSWLRVALDIWLSWGGWMVTSFLHFLHKICKIVSGWRLVIRTQRR